MGRSIQVFMGSPREHGNTQTLCSWIAEGAQAAGASVELVDAARLDYKVNGCIACMGCQALPEFECVVRDAAHPVLARMPEADALVFATPVYFFGPSAQLKLLLDRMYSLVKFKPEENRMEHGFGGKTLALVASAGGDLGSGLEQVEQMFGSIAGFLGMSFESLLVPFAPQDRRELAQRDDVKQEALAFGRTLAQG